MLLHLRQLGTTRPEDVSYVHGLSSGKRHMSSSYVYDSLMNHNWQAAFFSENVEQPRQFMRGPPGDSDEKIPLVVTNKCDSTIWPGVATQSGTGPGIGGFELATNKSRKL
ncbi:uncharacterized protein TrAtP1_012475 [Trichoderma atroviride]|uniref:uncharacterized protein n=1 Tax=Hypocrea atroviridis TaxID=63577 RepID=UPI00331F271C|nr:hypothetical protein TrAtP1_012475 [Trichoderma atroviride]